MASGGADQPAAGAAERVFGNPDLMQWGIMPCVLGAKVVLEAKRRDWFLECSEANKRRDVLRDLHSLRRVSKGIGKQACALRGHIRLPQDRTSARKAESGIRDVLGVEAQGERRDEADAEVGAAGTAAVANGSGAKTGAPAAEAGAPVAAAAARVSPPSVDEQPTSGEGTARGDDDNYRCKLSLCVSKSAGRVAAVSRSWQVTGQIMKGEDCQELMLCIEVQPRVTRH